MKFPHLLWDTTLNVCSNVELIKSGCPEVFIVYLQLHPPLWRSVGGAESPPSNHLVFLMACPSSPAPFPTKSSVSLDSATIQRDSLWKWQEILLPLKEFQEISGVWSRNQEQRSSLYYTSVSWEKEEIKTSPREHGNHFLDRTQPPRKTNSSSLTNPWSHTHCSISLLCNCLLTYLWAS